jgi:hypothetical protein
MFNSHLRNESNARLTWSLTGAQLNEKSGLLIIRDRRMAQGLFGKIAERGNFTPLIISVLLLIVCGFWMLLPVYGPMREEKNAVTRPLRQRFNAEIRFLSKHNALETYLHVYLSRLKQHITGAAGVTGSAGFAGSADEDEIQYIKQALSENIKEKNRKPLKNRDIIKALEKIQKYMEHL